MRAHSRLRFEILAGFAVIALVVWGLIALLVLQAHRHAVDSGFAAGRNIARSLAEYEDSSIRAIDLSLRQLREEWMREPDAFDRAVARHEEHLQKEKVIQVAVVGADGAVRYSRLPQTAPANFSDRDYFQAQKQRGTDELHVSEPVMGRVTRQWAIQVTRSLYDAQKRFAGVIVVAVPPPALEEVFGDIDLGSNGVITLARADGTILARSGGLARAADVSLAGVPGLADDSRTAGEFRRTAKIDGVERFFAFRKLQNYPLTLYVGQSVDAVLAPYYRVRNTLGAAGIIATTLLVAVALLLLARAQERATALEERERLMLDLHDGCIQSIYAIGLTLENCRRFLDKDPGQAARTLAEAGANLNLVIQDLRAFISAQRPTAFTEEAFMAEIERIIPAPGPGVPQFAVEVDRSIIPTLKPEEAAHVLRITREAVSNIVRHSSARSARVTLERRGSSVCLEVIDDGVGIAQRAQARLGLGLHHIHARARKLRGRAAVASVPPQARASRSSFRTRPES